MEWSDEGIVVRARPHGETSLVIDALTFERGLHAGLAKGGRGARARGLYQPGNRLTLTWRARIESQLGAYQGEASFLAAAAVLTDPLRLAGLASLCALIAHGVGEREPLPLLYAGLRRAIDALAADEADWLLTAIRFEALFLRELGHGLDLARCAVTGAEEGLAFVSPKTGRAVTVEGAGEWAPKLLALPPFLLEGDAAATPHDMVAGLALTGWFLRQRLFSSLDRPAPLARERFAALVQASFASREEDPR